MKYDHTASDYVSSKTGVKGKGYGLTLNHISPNGKYIIICANGLKVFEFALESKKVDEAGPQDDDAKETQRPIVLKELNWKVPISTDGMTVVELAQRVRFEANNIIRLRTKDSRDLLFLVSQNKTTQVTTVTKISEVQVKNFFKTEGH